MMRPDCDTCCFFRIVEANGKQRDLCQFTGARRPVVGVRGCHYIQGQWADIDAILGLQKVEDCGNLGFPNQVKPGSGLSINGEIVARKQRITLDDFRLNADSHISDKLKRRFTDPEPVRAGGSLDRGICESPFHV